MISCSKRQHRLYSINSSFKFWSLISSKAWKIALIIYCIIKHWCFLSYLHLPTSADCNSRRTYSLNCRNYEKSERRAELYCRCSQALSQSSFAQLGKLWSPGRFSMCQWLLEGCEWCIHRIGSSLRYLKTGTTFPSAAQNLPIER